MINLILTKQYFHNFWRDKCKLILFPQNAYVEADFYINMAKSRQIFCCTLFIKSMLN